MVNDTVKVSKEEEGDEDEYAVVRALGFKVRMCQTNISMCGSCPN